MGRSAERRTERQQPYAGAQEFREDLFGLGVGGTRGLFSGEPEPDLLAHRSEREGGAVQALRFSHDNKRFGPNT